MKQQQLGIVIVSMLLAVGASGCAFDSEEEQWADDIELSEGSEQLQLGLGEAEAPSAEPLSDVPEGEVAPDFGQGQLFTDPNPLPWHEQGTRAMREPSTPLASEASRTR